MNITHRDGWYWVWNQSTQVEYYLLCGGRIWKSFWEYKAVSKHQIRSSALGVQKWSSPCKLSEKALWKRWNASKLDFTELGLLFRKASLSEMGNTENYLSMACMPSLHGKYMEKQWKQWETLFLGAPKLLHMVTASMKLKYACSLEEKLWST